jgi:hypothetical protein
MKSIIVTLIATIAMPLTFAAAPEPQSDKNAREIAGKEPKLAEKENAQGFVGTRFHSVKIKDMEAAAAKLKEQIQEKSFQVVPDERTSRMFLMGSQRAIDQAVALLDKMERE